MTELDIISSILSAFQQTCEDHSTWIQCFEMKNKLILYRYLLGPPIGDNDNNNRIYYQLIFVLQNDVRKYISIYPDIDFILTLIYSTISS